MADLRHYVVMKDGERVLDESDYDKATHIAEKIDGSVVTLVPLRPEMITSILYRAGYHVADAEPIGSLSGGHVIYDGVEIVDSEAAIGPLYSAIQDEVDAINGVDG